MQQHHRKQLLSQALEVQQGSPVTRDVMEAALWTAFGWDPAAEALVACLMRVMDAYADASSRRAVINWSRFSDEPLPVAALAHHPLRGIATQLRAAIAVRNHVAATAARDAAAKTAAAEVAAIRRARPTLTVVQQPVPQQRSRMIPVNKLPPGTSQCTNPECRKVLPLSEFWGNRRRKNGVDYHCKECKRRERREYDRLAAIRRSREAEMAEAEVPEIAEVTEPVMSGELSEESHDAAV
jgi:hypothetical protein